MLVTYWWSILDVKTGCKSYQFSHTNVASSFIILSSQCPQHNLNVVEKEVENSSFRLTSEYPVGGSRSTTKKWLQPCLMSEYTYFRKPSQDFIGARRIFFHSSNQVFDILIRKPSQGMRGTHPQHDSHGSVPASHYC